MSDELGPLTFGRRQEQVFLGRDIARDRNYSEAVAFAIDKEARHTMDACYSRARELLEKNLDHLHLVAQTLMEKEILTGDEFEQLISSNGKQAENEASIVEQMPVSAEPRIRFHSIKVFNFCYLGWDMA